MSARLTPRERAERAGMKASHRHNEFTTDEDGWIVCKCKIVMPSADIWGDHYAGEVLGAALNALESS